MERMYHILLETLHHRGEECIAIRFPISFELNKLVRQIPSVKFSNTNKCWYVTRKADSVGVICDVFQKNNISVDRSKLDNTDTAKLLAPHAATQDQHLQTLRMMEQKLNLKGYSPITRKNYLSQFKSFLSFFGDASPIDLTEVEIRNYLIYLIEKKKVSRSSQNQAINSIHPVGFKNKLACTSTFTC